MSVNFLRYIAGKTKVRIPFRFATPNQPNIPLIAVIMIVMIMMM